MKGETMTDTIREISTDEPVQIALGDERFSDPEAPATQADIARLEGKIDLMIRTFENLGDTFEGAIGEFANGPMGKLFGKLLGGSHGGSDTST